MGLDFRYGPYASQADKDRANNHPQNPSNPDATGEPAPSPHESDWVPKPSFTSPSRLMFSQFFNGIDPCSPDCKAKCASAAGLAFAAEEARFVGFGSRITGAKNPWIMGGAAALQLTVHYLNITTINDLLNECTSKCKSPDSCECQK